ncbi:hypothetical protein C9I57_31665 [Trinickia symbiotica]|uniref:Uncharacterized protein n=1 Tax=Trinickia symbiotica TaxID=863227 RepID=A0A2T3XJV5_9BURK|nr:hypothetical protein C9I57_31665 [Trinickia symbiotica]
MPFTEPYTETTSLDFILNPFKLFFTACVVHVTPILEIRRQAPTIFVRAAREARCVPYAKLQAHRSASKRKRAHRDLRLSYVGEPIKGHLRSPSVHLPNSGLSAPRRPCMPPPDSHRGRCHSLRRVVAPYRTYTCWMPLATTFVRDRYNFFRGTGVDRSTKQHMVSVHMFGP